VDYAGRSSPAAALATLTLSPWAWAAQAMTLWSMLSLSMLAGGLGHARPGSPMSSQA
jgi:hypothetical protein